MRSGRGPGVCSGGQPTQRTRWLLNLLLEQEVTAIDTIGLTSAAFLIVTWLLYPGFVAVISKAVPRRRFEDREAIPFVSVVIASRDEIDAIASRVEDCLATSYDASSIEFVVALDAGGAAGDASRLVGLDDRVRVVLGDEPGGKAATLNAGVRACRGEVIVLADTHQRFDPDAIPQLVAALADPMVGAVSGSLELPRPPEAEAWLVREYWRFERWLRHREARIHSSVGVTGAIYAIRRSLWTPLPAGLILDDVYGPMTIVMRGYRVAFAESARAYEIRRLTPLQEYRRKVRTLTGVFQLCAWLPRVLSPAANPIWVQFVSHKLLRLLTPYCTVGILLWLASRVASWRYGYLVGLLVVAAAAAASLALKGRSAAGERVRGMVVQAGLLQAAIVVGMLNGLTGRWNVWREH